MAIRILHVMDTLEVGGTERGVVNLIHRMDPERFEHVVCTVRNLGALADGLPRERVKLMCLDKTNPGYSFHAGILAKRIREVQPHILHSRNWGTIEAVFAGRWVRSCALVHSEHGFEFGNTQPESWRRRWFRRLAFELADQVFSVSYQLRDLHAKRTGFPASKIGVIHNGVDTERFFPQPAIRARVRQRLGITPEEFCIGAVGRLEHVKDFITLLRAAAEFPDSDTRWCLLIVGEGRELSTLQQFVSSRRNLQDRVHFLGEIQDVTEILNALDVYVLPSLSEGISNSLLEAMATGLPVIASATGGNPEVVVDGESGQLFPVGEFGRLAKLLLILREQNELRARLGWQTLQRVKEYFSLASMVRKYEQLYSSLAPSQDAASAAVIQSA